MIPFRSARWRWGTLLALGLSALAFQFMLNYLNRAEAAKKDGKPATEASEQGKRAP